MFVGGGTGGIFEGGVGGIAEGTVGGVGTAEGGGGIVPVDGALACPGRGGGTLLGSEVGAGGGGMFCGLKIGNVFCSSSFPFALRIEIFFSFYPFLL